MELGDFFDPFSGRGLLKRLAFPYAGVAAAFPDSFAEVAKRQVGLVPQLEDEVTVEVKGQPGSNKQQLYFLALATANGIVRRFNSLTAGVSPAMGMIMIEYDAADSWVRSTIKYRWSMASANVSEIGFPGPGTIFDNLAVYRGPQCEVVGGNFDFVDKDVLSGIPKSSVSPEAPQLPFEGRTILTSCPTTIEPVPKPITQNPAPSRPIAVNRRVLSPNPKPPGDNRSRGAVVMSQEEKNAADIGATITPGSQVGSSNSDPKICCEKLMGLIPMVMAALSAPATNSDMRFGTPFAGPLGG